MTDRLKEAAQALVDRWDTPNWKDAPHTGKYINELRAALAEHDQLRDAAKMIDERFAGRLAIALECMTFDPTRFWESSTKLLDEYKAAWETVNPSPPTFMGEPMPPERRERLKKAMADRAEAALRQKNGG